MMSIAHPFNIGPVFVRPTTLYQAVGTSLDHQRHDAELLRSYFEHAELKL